jgi:hypothetical protein
MIIGQDFKFRDDYREHDTMPIEILTGAYKGVILRYTNVVIQETEEETATLKFGFDIIESPSIKKKELRDDERFMTEAGLILNAMILEMVGDTDAVGENYSEEPVEQRAVRP